MFSADRDDKFELAEWSDAIAGALKPHHVDLPSALWSHPTIWFYLMCGWRHGAW
jgi:hypothetical protein